MENIKILSEDKIITLKTNSKEVQKLMKDNKGNNWLKDFFKEEDPFIKSKYYMNNFELDMSAQDPKDTDFENAKRLYENLKHIPDSVACDERLWVGLAFGKYYDYLMYRWNPCEGKTKLDYRWLFKFVYRRSLFFHGLSKLFWFAKYTYIDGADDPYKLTKFCFDYPDLLEKMIFRNYTNSKIVRLALIMGIKQFIEDGGNFSTKIMYSITKYISFLGGAYILDSFTQEELQGKVYDKLIQLFVEENPTQTTFKL